MTVSTPEERISETAEMLQSLKASIQRLRKQAENLSQNLQDGEEVELAKCTREVSALEGLVRTCLKVEASLVEQTQRHAGIVQGGHALDLDTARSEILGRLDRLRGAGDTPDVPG